MRFAMKSLMPFLAITVMSTPSSAETSQEWIVQPFVQTIRYWDGEDFEKGDFTGIVLRTLDESRSGTALACMSGFGLSAKIFLEPGSTDDKSVVVLDHRKGREGELVIEGDISKQSIWAYNADRREAVSYDPEVVGLLFDAAMRGKSASLKIQNKSPHDISLPAADESFSAFVEMCPFLGSPG